MGKGNKQRPGIYVSAAIAGLKPDSEFRQTTRRIIKFIQDELGYDVLDDHLLCETALDMKRLIAKRIGALCPEIGAEPAQIVDYDINLLRSPRCYALVADVSVVSFGVGAELHEAAERLKQDPWFGTLVLCKAEEFSRRCQSAFVARFQGGKAIGAGRWTDVQAYEAPEQALALVRSFIDAHVRRRPMR